MNFVTFLRVESRLLSNVSAEGLTSEKLSAIVTSLLFRAQRSLSKEFHVNKDIFHHFRVPAKGLVPENLFAIVILLLFMAQT